MVYAFRDDVMTILLRFGAGARRSSNPIMHPQRTVFLAELSFMCRKHNLANSFKR